MTDEMQERNDAVRKANEDKIIEIAKAMLDGNYTTVTIGIQYLKTGAVEEFTTGIIPIARGLQESLLEDTKYRQQKMREEQDNWK